MIISSLQKRLKSQKNDLEYFLVMFKSLESLQECAQPFFLGFHEIKSTCYSSEVEIKTADFLFRYKKSDNFLFCLFVKFWRFLKVPVGTSI